MIAPYYEDGSVTIYHADCRDILPELPKVDLVLTDPPYGVSYVLAPQVVGRGNRRIMRGGKPPVYGDDKPFNPAHILGFNRVIMFGANHYSDQLPVSGGWFVWDKTGGGRGPHNSFSDVELAWSNVRKTPCIYHHLWKGLVRDSEAGNKVLHPTQKPVALMAAILKDYSELAQTILDPYMGSGTTLRAAKDLGRKAIGIEIEERYAEIAARRMGQEVLDFSERKENRL